VRSGPQLEPEIKKFIIETLALEDISPEDIKSTEPLFGEGLALDSVDALELGVALQERYGITLKADAQGTRSHFESVQNLAQFVAQNRKK
jgi:acyl carrier protein